MSNKAETQYNPQCGERRTIFSDEYDFLTKIEEKLDCNLKKNYQYIETERVKIITINEQISNFAQTYPTNLKASSNEALLFMRR